MRSRHAPRQGMRRRLPERSTSERELSCRAPRLLSIPMTVRCKIGALGLAFVVFAWDDDPHLIVPGRLLLLRHLVDQLGLEQQRLGSVVGGLWREFSAMTPLFDPLVAESAYEVRAAA